MAQLHELEPQPKKPAEPEEFVPIRLPIGGVPFLAGEIMVINRYNETHAKPQKVEPPKKSA